MLKKILGINLLVFVAYAMLITINSSMADKGFNIAIGMGVCIVIQVALNMVAAIACLIMGKKGSWQISSNKRSSAGANRFLYLAHLAQHFWVKRT